MDNRIHWKDLEVAKPYYTKMMGATFGCENPYMKVIIIRIQNMSNNEAMIFTQLENGYVRGYAVGGRFEGFIGPKNRFWEEIPNTTIISNILPTAAAA